MVVIKSLQVIQLPLKPNIESLSFSFMVKGMGGDFVEMSTRM